MYQDLRKGKGVGSFFFGADCCLRFAFASRWRAAHVSKHWSRPLRGSVTTRYGTWAWSNRCTPPVRADMPASGPPADPRERVRERLQNFRSEMSSVDRG